MLRCTAIEYQVGIKQITHYTDLYIVNNGAHMRCFQNKFYETSAGEKSSNADRLPMYYCALDQTHFNNFNPATR